MSNKIVKIKYHNGYREEIGYTTDYELEKVRQGESSFIWFTDNRSEIENGRVIYGYTLDYLKITKIYDKKGD